ncbi:MAG: DUF1836 domain-containing protein [Solobacterium sp.]|nr:DUF1836 domain-containing protein [Solobacterium sp.]
MSDQLTTFELPAWNEIPNVGLYLEQVTKYLNTYLEPFDMGVTSSMISNYVKLKIISREGRKIYNRERIASLFFVAVAKTVLSMDQIRVLRLEEAEHAVDEEFYNRFVSSLKEQLAKSDNLKSSSRKGSQDELLELVTAAVAGKMRVDSFFREADNSREAE